VFYTLGIWTIKAYLVGPKTFGFNMGGVHSDILISTMAGYLAPHRHVEPEYW